MTNNSSSNSISAAARTTGDWPDYGECTTIAALHSINSTTFNRYLNNYWTTHTVAEAYCISWNTLIDLLQDEQYAGMRFQFLWNNQAFNDNEVEIGFENDPDIDSEEARRKWKKSQEDTNELTSYSFKLFYGIFYLNTTVIIRLYKGQNDDGTKTILIESIGGGIHAFYDLSSEHP